jgi:SSS family solute:Na+ symporter/sodium/pantothenate symporter
MKVAWPQSASLSLAEDAAAAGFDRIYLFVLLFFTVTVVGYTLVGGFLAAVWTDLFQSVMMFVGVLVLLMLALPAAGGLENATRQAMEHTSPQFALGPGHAADGRQFLPVALAFSFFLIWPFTNFSSPAGAVRVMACRDTLTIRRSIIVLSIYNFLIYLPLVAICICARAVMKDLAVSDEVIPRMALLTTSKIWGGSWIAGLILAAPFGAIMATVSTYLVVIASGLVRDIYQRFLRPHATQREIRLLSYSLMVIVGAIALVANIRPVAYLQAIVVFSGTGAAATFLVPIVMAAYWHRATAAGALAAMLAGAGTMFCLFAMGWMGPDPMIGAKTSFRPYFLLGMEPIVWGLCMSLIAGVGVSLWTKQRL